MDGKPNRRLAFDCAVDPVPGSGGHYICVSGVGGGVGSGSTGCCQFVVPPTIDAFAAELIDRFGPLPDAAENLLQVVALKALCRQAGVDKVDAGPKGAVIGFRNDYFANPAGLVGWLTTHQGTAKLRPDHKLVFMRRWDTPADRFEGVQYVATELARIAAA